MGGLSLGCSSSKKSLGDDLTHHLRTLLAQTRLNDIVKDFSEFLPAVVVHHHANGPNVLALAAFCVRGESTMGAFC